MPDDDQLEVQETMEDEPAEEDVPVYVYAILMLPSGEVKLVTDLPFRMQRQAHSSDVIMTAGFVADQVKSGAPF
jgi:hypothetical protein